MPTKQIHITNPETILKLESLELKTGYKSPKIVDKALDAYILSISKESHEQSKQRDLISAFVTIK
jgi:hypothetical protein